MSDEMPDVIYVDEDSLGGMHVHDEYPHFDPEEPPGLHAYCFFDPAKIKPDDAVVISKAEREREDEQTTESFDLMHARMTSAEQKLAALVEAVKAYRDQQKVVDDHVRGSYRWDEADDRLEELAVTLDTLAQQDQSKEQNDE